MDQNKETEQIAEAPLKRFWDKKKELISFTGIVIAISSMFLSVPIPEQINAAEALRMIQFLSILVMSISIAWLWVLFLSFSYQLESHLSKKSGLQLDNTISNAVFLVAFYFVYNLWVYVISLYKTEWQKVVGGFQTAVGFVVIAIVIYFADKVYGIRNTVSWFSVGIRLIAYSMLVSVIPTLWSLFSRLQFVFSDMARSYLLNITFYFILAMGVFAFRMYSDRKNIEKHE